jgi:hypothetical protein
MFRNIHSAASYGLTGSEILIVHHIDLTVTVASLLIKNSYLAMNKKLMYLQDNVLSLCCIGLSKP